MPPKKRILVTGSNGLLGQKLISLLSDQKEVFTIATAMGPNRLPFQEGYVYHEMDVTDPESLEEIILLTRPEVIIHTAAMTNVDTCELQKDACWKLNVKAVEHLIKICEREDIFLQHLSTDFVFDGNKGPYIETDQPNPISFYGWSKYAAEMAIQHASLRWAITRTVLVYGIAHDMSRSNIILWVKKSLENGQSIQVVTDQYRSPTLAEDLAMGCWLIAQKEAQGIFHISGPDQLSPYEMAQQAANYFGLDQGLIGPTDASQFTQPARRPPKTGFILTKARNELGYNPKSFLDGLKVLSRQLLVI
ncbi:dTDP-4-dehydrorhamnose reductase [Dyadobacter jejuensis]|uniref:dTDP-4-dehydrorhamnose reductase n=1 Tax=Dyadobacter jejuensis TaxID=1082580 RepID=A0A316ART9_9BACT|nr:dTDP-4-dehydrorhamnose reductase [Dyadobacter jejuensis]PWJ59560.1 dTDP-4-dehydrorhamnose reductase [Dyadobacter jejuensis]